MQRKQKMVTNPSCRIALAGYGHLGSRLVKWLAINAPEVKIEYVIEPDASKDSEIKKLKLSRYEHIKDIPRHLLKQIDIVVDCSTKGQGKINKENYKKLNIPAIFQNGEDIEIAQLYYPGIKNHSRLPRFVRIPCCSAMSVLRILMSLQEIESIKVKRVYGYHNKTSNDSRMITINYVSGEEIKRLLGIEATMNRIYLRGKPHNDDYVYAGNIQLELDGKITTNTFKKILNTLEKSADLRVVSQDIDTRDLDRTTNTLVIKESIVQNLNTISMAFLSLPPEIDFPANLAAIKLYAKNNK